MLYDETMTWTALPLGHAPKKAMTLLFSCGGPIGSSKAFTVYRDGTAKLV